jgi:ketosteroid isomerase-like protein
MKRIAMTALILVAALSISVSVSQGKDAGDKAGLEKTVNTFFGFVKSTDLDKIKSYYTADYTFTGPNGKMMGGEERLQVMKNQAGTFVSASDISVRTYGSTGIATGIANTKNSSGAAEQSRFIQVWIWEGGRWRLAASQVTLVG